MAFSACPICSREEIKTERAPYEEVVYLVMCPNCGDYLIDWRAKNAVKHSGDKHLLSGICREASLIADRNEYGSDQYAALVRLKADNIDDVLRRAPRGVLEKPTRLLMNIEQITKVPGDEIELSYHQDLPLAFCDSIDEFRFYVNYLIEAGYLSELGGETNQGLGVAISMTGWSHIESLRIKGSFSDRGFVAMWFNPQLDRAFTHGFVAGALQAGYNAVRVDREEFNGGIFDRVRASINESRFLIGDLTGTRPNAYLEIGYAMGRGMDVILTCRKDYIEGDEIADELKVQFDVRHMNVIIWENEGQLASKLRDRILGTIGRGTYQQS